jgi:methanogenic corrinoid protein MtbC1
VTYLGADTPLRAIAEVAERIAPDVIVLAALLPEPLHHAADGLAEISARHPVAVGGSGAHPKAALRAGARLVREDPVAAARSLTEAQLG